MNYEDMSDLFSLPLKFERRGSDGYVAFTKNDTGFIKCYSVASESEELAIAEWLTGQAHRVAELEAMLTDIVEDAKSFEKRSGKAVSWRKCAELVLRGEA